jgi:hypothetical protein
VVEVVVGAEVDDAPARGVASVAGFFERQRRDQREEPRLLGRTGWSEFRQGEGPDAVLHREHRHRGAARELEPPAYERRWPLAPIETLPVFDNSRSLPWVAQYGFRFAEGVPELSETIHDPPRSARAMLWLQGIRSRARRFRLAARDERCVLRRLFQ